MNGLTATYGFYDALAAGKINPVTQFDQSVNFLYASGVPPLATYPSTNYSVTWTGAIAAAQTGTYTFYLTVDDSARLGIGDAWILDRLAYSGGSATTIQGSVALSAGVHTPLFLRYWQGPGTAQAKLEWSGPGVTRQVVPASALFPTGWTHIEAPLTSYGSPVSAIIHHRSVDVPAVTASAGGTLVGSLLDAGLTAKVAELKLSPTQSVTVSVSSGGETQSRSVAWSPIDLAAPPASPVLVRVGDQVLVKARAGHVPTLTKAYGTPINLTTTGGGFYLATLPSDGHFSISDGAGGAGAAVTAFAVNVASSFRSGTVEVDADGTVQVPIPVLPSDALTATLPGTFEADLKVASDATLAGTADIQVFNAGASAKSYLRIGTGGPILGVANISGYKLTSGAANIDTVNADGSKSGIADVLIYPYFKNLDYSFAMRVHTATFKGGATSFTVKTDGTASSLGETGFAQVTLADGRIAGKFSMRVLFPAGETKWCFTASPQQIGQ
ncbi:MAG: hypothetical protein H0X38_12400 [Planctomycetes bacterium]|nr:hypothetical protein [Planctomycetota bacterium]